MSVCGCTSPRCPSMNAVGCVQHRTCTHTYKQYTYVRAHVCTCTPTACMYMITYAYGYICARMHVNAHVHTSVLNTFIHVDMHKGTSCHRTRVCVVCASLHVERIHRIHTCVHIYTHMRAYMCVNPFKCVYICRKTCTQSTSCRVCMYV